MQCDVSFGWFAATYLFTDNETNPQRHPGVPTTGDGHYKDAFHAYASKDEPMRSMIDRWARRWRRIRSPDSCWQSVTIRARNVQCEQVPSEWFGAAFEEIFSKRIAEADAFYAKRIPQSLDVTSDWYRDRLMRV